MRYTNPRFVPSSSLNISIPASTLQHYNSSNCRSRVAGTCTSASNMPQDSISDKQQAQVVPTDGFSTQQQDKQQQLSTSTSFTDIGLEELRQQLQDFAAERHWEQFHTPRNLLLALVGEVNNAFYLRQAYTLSLLLRGHHLPCACSQLDSSASAYGTIWHSHRSCTCVCLLACRLGSCQRYSSGEERCASLTQPCPRHTG